MADHRLPPLPEKKELFQSPPRSFLFSHGLPRLLGTISWCVAGGCILGGNVTVTAELLQAE